MATRKPMGRCPHCEKRVRAVVVEENVVRRDVLRCPKCKGRVLICLGADCKNYAAGGRIYDDNFCPKCIAAAGKAIDSLEIKLHVGDHVDDD